MARLAQEKHLAEGDPQLLPEHLKPVLSAGSRAPDAKKKMPPAIPEISGGKRLSVL
jgi:hypothetical protein